MVSDVILKGMEISQDKRYQSAREMQKALRDAFAEMQSAMAARTQVFSVPPQPPVEPVPTPVPEEAVSTSDVSAPAPPPVGVSEFDATIRYDAQADAVRADEAQVTADEAQAVHGANTDGSGVNEGKPSETADPMDVGVPASAESQGYVSVPTAEINAAAFLAGSNSGGQADRFATQTGGVAVADAPPAPVHTVPARKSASKAPMIIVGLVAALVLLGAASVGGWFAYQKYYALPVVQSSPTPTPAATPSPTPTPVPVLETNTNGNSNTDVNGNVTTEPTPVSGEPGTTPKPGVKATPAKTAPKTPAPAKTVDRLKTEQ